MRYLTWVLPLLMTSLCLAQNKPYRLPSVDLKQRIIWGSECLVSDDLGLAFGGQDQQAGRGPPTRYRVAGEWKELAAADNRPEVAVQQALTKASGALKSVAIKLRKHYFSDDLDKATAAQLADEVVAAIQQYRAVVDKLGGDRVQQVLKMLQEDTVALERRVVQSEGRGLGRAEIELLLELATRCEIAAEAYSAAPPDRAISPLVYDKKSGLFVLLGGDHLDYLTNDTWAFDPKRLQWELRLPATAPPPRANHQLTANDKGQIVLRGGYTYASNTDYTGGQYVDHDDGEWTYDVSKNQWSGGDGVSPLTRTYRTGKFHPNYFLQGPPPDRAAHAKVLEQLPANTWVSLQPPHLPEMNRDWGTAVLDTDRDLILRWSGGHSAHGGSDVLHYHIATNRWELPFPVEFPLGQTYSNTEYPEGLNFNGRPWVTGHTYQNYGYDSRPKKMVFTGRAKDCFLWDPDRADWQGQFAKPSGMTYGSSFFTLTLTPTAQGLVCWTNEGRLFQFDGVDKWTERKLSGEKLPGSIVDNSTIVYDSKRNRLLAVVKEYGDKTEFSGELSAVDCSTWEVTKLSPKNKHAARNVPYLCQLRYDSQHDLLLVGGTLPPDENGKRLTPAYDCAGKRWVSLNLGGDDPSGERGRNVSLGLMYHESRRLFVAVDTKSHVFALRLEPASADLREMQ